MKFVFIAAEKARAPVSALCRVLGVTRSGFYAWQARDLSEQAIDDQKLALEIAAIHKASGETYGSPRVHAELHAKGLEVSRKRVARLMRELGIRSRRKRRFKATTDSGHKLPVADNVLDRKFEVDAPDVAWVTDITYVWTDEGWLYLAAILDLFSRRVVGHALSERIDRALVLEALRDAVGRRVPDAGLLHHSDRGSQYASHDYFTDALSEHGITCSMSRKGNCWDATPPGRELLRATLKTECIYSRLCFATRAEAPWRRSSTSSRSSTIGTATRHFEPSATSARWSSEPKFIEEKQTKARVRKRGSVTRLVHGGRGRISWPSWTPWATRPPMTLTFWRWAPNAMSPPPIRPTPRSHSVEDPPPPHRDSSISWSPGPGAASRMTVAVWMRPARNARSPRAIRRRGLAGSN